MLKDMRKGVAGRILGTMSGTSLDGVDAAVIETDGECIVGFGETGFRPYTDEERAILRRALGRWDGPEVVEAGEVVVLATAELASGFEEVALVGFHGQTLAHDPKGRGTLQAGDGALLADLIERPVAWDFRSADVKLGGEGAPLAPFYHHALARHVGETEPVAFLNLGGVGNLTWVDPSRDAPEADGALLAFDTGPANAPLNDLIQRRLGKSHDESGALARTGEVDAAILERFLSNVYFSRIPPKSLDRDAWGPLVADVKELPDADAAATLTACAAAAVMRAMEHCPVPTRRVLATGGGRHNETMMEMIRAGLDCPIVAVEALGLDGDMLEAQAFGFLAGRVLRGLATSAPGTTGVSACVGGGTISAPGEG